jgi:transcriptional regulator with XRE-family HTH domain
MIFKDVLKELRTKNGITQEELANYLNVTRPTIAGYETKGKEPDYATLISISDFFNVSIDYLLTGTDAQISTIDDESDNSLENDLILEIYTKAKTLSPSELERLLDYENLLLLRKNQNCQ